MSPVSIRALDTSIRFSYRSVGPFRSVGSHSIAPSSERDHFRVRRVEGWVVPAMLIASGEAHATTLSIGELRYLADRSPNVFDMYFLKQRSYESRLPTVLVDLDLVIGPTLELRTERGVLESTIAGGCFSIG